MSVRDSHLGRPGKQVPGSIQRIDDILRWEELEECVRFHTQMALLCWIPSTYRMVNDPSSYQKEWLQGREYTLCRSGNIKDVFTEVEEIHSIMENVSLDQPRCPLKYCIRALAKEIKSGAQAIAARDRNVTVILCTQGRPTTRDGDVGSKIMRDLEDELQLLSELPVKIIVRLCTDSEEVRDAYNHMDSRFDSIDVIDDFWGEALEVYLHNPWLTYTMGMHRLRESGLAPDTWDDLDERCLSLDDIHELCKMLLLRHDSKVSLPHPEENWDAFFHQIKVLVSDEKLQWNPVKKKMMPWLDLRKLEGMNPNNKIVRELPSTPSYTLRPPVHEEQKKREPRYTYKGLSDGRGGRRTNPALISVARDMESCVHRWAHAKPNYDTMHPLERLLITMSKGISITIYEYHAVEPHKYFGKCKAFDKIAFQDCESDEEYRELLIRAVKKTKSFLNPNRYPDDFTKSQTEFLMTIRDIIRDSEEASLGYGANY